MTEQPSARQIDWSQTDQARHNRRAKAAKLAAAARELGHDAHGIAVGAGHRRAVRLRAGLASVSEETWAETALLLAEDPPPTRTAPTRPCALCGSTDDVHPYLCGPRCATHSPAALAGHPAPRPDPDHGLIALRARRATLVATSEASAPSREQQPERMAHHLFQAQRAANLAARRRGRRRT